MRKPTPAGMLLFSWAALVALVTLIWLALPSVPVSGNPSARVPLPVQEFPQVSGVISVSDHWGPGQIVISGDIVVGPTAVLTIHPGTTILIATVDSANLGLDPRRVEWIISGTLRVNGPVTITSHSASPAGGDWVGLRFQPGSKGWVEGTTIEYGVVGISVDGALPVLTSNVIRYMRGDQGATGADGIPGVLESQGTAGGDGQPAYGIYITGVCTPVVQHNTVYSIAGGMGGQGGDGLSPEVAGANGADGGHGGAGGAAVGILAGPGAAPQVLSNTLVGIHGGAGAPAGRGGAGAVGGDGAAYGAPGTAGGQGGTGAAGGPGGGAWGLYLQGTGASTRISHNRVQEVTGGTGGRGGSGGAGGRGGQGSSGLNVQQGGAGGPGGAGGSGGPAGAGGPAYGLELQSRHGAAHLTGNRFVQISSGPGGSGGAGGEGGAGGGGAQGGNAYALSGQGGAGGDGQEGGDGGPGGESGPAAGLLLMDVTGPTPVEKNRVAGLYTASGGAGGSGGPGGDGGSGGPGGNDLASPPLGPGGKGGSGGNGGPGGNAGSGGKGGDVAALRSLETNLRVVNNLLHNVAAGPAGGGGQGGEGGAGGRGGDAGLPWVPGHEPPPNNWGGWGGYGGAGGAGGHGGGGGPSVGLLAEGSAVDYWHNTSANVGSGQLAAEAGNPGAAGTAGPAGDPPSDPNEPPPSPGVPGQAGTAGDVGVTVGIWAADGTTLRAVNNIVAGIAAPGHDTYGLRADRGASVTLSHNNVWTHTVPYSGVARPTTDLAQDPLFVDGPAGDFHLQHGSPCLEAGAELPVSEDHDGQPRPLGNAADIGHDEVAPLVLFKAVDRERALPGSELVYRLAVTNPDPHAVMIGGLLTDLLPGPTSLVAGPICSQPLCAPTAPGNGEAVTWRGDLAADSSVTVVFTAAVDYGLEHGTPLVNQASLSAGAQTGWSAEAVTILHTPFFTLSKAAGSTPIAGLPFPYTLFLSNTSPDVADSHVVVTDAVPAGAHWVSGGSHEGGIVHLTFPTVKAGAQVSASWIVSTCQTSLTNRHYRVATSDLRMRSGWGPALTSTLAPPTLVPGFSLSDAEPMVGDIVTLTDTSTTNGAPLAAWAWDLGDGATAYGTQVSHVYETAQSVTVTLTITDGCGFSRSVAMPRALEVLPAPPCTQVESVDLRLATAGDLDLGQTLWFSLDISPDDAQKPYSLQFTVDGTRGFVVTSSDDPLLFTERFLHAGVHTVEVAVWNCRQTQTRARTDSLEFRVPTKFRAYLPLAHRR
jgi:uncharacterized repeat protein (TIGR01451 family)